MLTHARALLTSTPEGATAYLDADLRDPETIVEHPDLRRTLDLDRPVAVMLIAIMHFVFDDDKPYEIVRQLVDALPTGSYLVMSHGTGDLPAPEVRARAEAELRAGRLRIDARPRTKDEIAGFFTGLDLVEPGIVPIVDWHPTVPEDDRPPVCDVAMYGAVARKG